MKRVTSDLRAALGAVSVILLLSACAGAGGDVTRDTNPRWDVDGDSMSNAVEMESHNKNLYGLDPAVWNFNPTIVSGTRSSNGALIDGLNLPDTGFGYIHYTGDDLKDSDDWGTMAMFDVLEGVGRNYRARDPCHSKTLFLNRDGMARPQFLDISRQGGGSFPPHKEHQNGLDTDVRYLATGSRSSAEGPLDLSKQLDLLRYDQYSTVELIQCFLNDPRVIGILYDAELTNFFPGEGETRLIDRHFTFGDHTDHFHVRIADPDGTSN